MVENLKQYLDEFQCEGFKSTPRYNSRGDFVSYFFKDVPYVAERVDDVLTVYLAEKSRELIGCKIKGVRHILKTAGEFGITVDGGDIRLGLFFFLGAWSAKDDAERQRYYEELQRAGDTTIDRALLPLS